MTNAHRCLKPFVPVAGLLPLILSLALIGCPASPNNDTAVVPYLSGLLQADADAALLAASLLAGDVTTAYSDTIGVGRVVSQNPYAGISVARGTAVMLVISLGPTPIEVPDVVGLALDAAQAALTDAGFTSTVAEVFSETVPAGSVVSQAPEGGSTAALGGNVELEVSKGPDRVTVPDVTGMTQSAAETALTDGRLILGEVAEEWSDAVDAGLVIGQDPIAGGSVAPGTAVDVVISKGQEPLTVPNVVGMDVREVEAALVAAGFTLGAITEAVNDSTAPDLIMAQDPMAGELAGAGAAVNLAVSLGSHEMVLHTEAWRDVVAAAAADKQSKYGIYASRSLMVANPEVYLAADAVWMEQLVTVYGGWQAEYEHRDRLNDGDYWYTIGGPIQQILHDDTTFDGSEFAWDSFQWENHRANAAALHEMYDEKAPFRNWLDMRLPMMWNALKGTGWRTPMLSLGEALYFQMRQDNEGVYLLVTDAERAYVAVTAEVGATLYDPLTGEASTADAIEGEVVLAMNDQYAWYPLMGRDDTGSDENLGKAVEAFCTPGSIPALTRAEEDVLAAIASATGLTSDMDRAWATLFATRFGDVDAWVSRVVRELCREIFYVQYDELTQLGNVPDSPYEHVALNMVVTEIANRLSPAAAVLAMQAIENDESVDDSLSAFNQQYSAWFERTDTAGVFGAYSEIWVPSLDDKVISKVGNGLSEACNTGAALYIAGMPDWQVWITHGWLGGSNGTRWLSGVYTPGGDRSVSVGVFDAGSPTCQHGPIFGSGFEVPVNALLYKLGAGYLYMGERVIPLPFTNLPWEAADSLVAELAVLEPGARVATGDPSLVTPKDLAWVESYLDTIQGDWIAFEFPPISTSLVLTPTVTGLLFDEAVAALRALELMIGYVDYGLSPYFEAGYVASQLPAAGLYVVPGTAIDLSVSTGLLPEE
jgi:beta-lactam-binding protein with PASTA domain